jgi:hypothetical protein
MTQIFQYRVFQWVKTCFGLEIANNVVERNHRFFEEATELVQSTGMTKSECLQLVDYVYSRPVGEIKQEIGGAIVTLNALCGALDIDLVTCGETELLRVWEKLEQIREKNANKPKHSPLPLEVSNNISQQGTQC